MTGKDSDEILACLSGSGRPFPLARERAHRERVPHLVVRVLGFSAAGEFLVQRRSASRETHPGAYTDTASGHVSFHLALLFDPPGFYVSEALRELEEEMGVSVLGEKGSPYIRPFGEPRYSPEAFETAHCFVAAVQGQPRPNDEVDAAGTGYVSRSELEKMLAEEEFVPEARDLWLDLLRYIGPNNPFDFFFGV